MPTPDPLYMLRGCAQPITALHCFNSKLFVGTQNGGIFVWDLKTRRIVWNDELAHSDGVSSVVYDGDDVITSQGRDGMVKKWKMEGDGLSLSGEFRYTAVGFFPMIITNSGHYLLTSSNSPGQLDLLEKSGRHHGNLVVKETGERKYGMAMVARQHDNVIFVGYEDGSVAMWNATNFELVSREKFHNDSLMALDVSRESTRGISGSADNKIQLWTFENQSLKATKFIEITNPGINSIRIRKDDKIFACACWDGMVRVFSMKKLTFLAVLNAHQKAIRCIEFDRDDYLYVGSDDGIISVWGIYCQ